METTLLPFSRPEKTSTAVRNDRRGRAPGLLCFARNDNETRTVKLLAARKDTASDQERPFRKPVP